MHNDCVSLIVPCYNHGTTLERAVRSALPRQGLGELIIVDDVSTDDSLAVGRRLAAEDARIRLLAMKNNAGPAAARNRGAQEAHGDYLSFLDADDELIDDFFVEAIKMFATHPPMQVVKTDELFFDPVKGYILPAFDPRYQAAVLSAVHGLVIRRDTFLRLGGFPEDAAFRGLHGGEDVAFMQATMTHLQPVGRIARPCYKVWSQAGSHVDRYLANTRVIDGQIEFIHLSPDQMPGGMLHQALSHYLQDMTERMSS